jgi:hypothetical protein
MSQDGSVFTWGPQNINQPVVESEVPRMSQDGSVFTWDHHNMDQGGREQGRRMSQDGSVFTWGPRNMDQGGVESKEQECHKMALYSPGTPVT